MNTLDLNCTCGHPECHQNLAVRKGYVNRGGRESWDELYINTYGIRHPCNDAECQGDHYGEVMLERHDALRLAWWLVRHFLWSGWAPLFKA